MANHGRTIPVKATLSVDGQATSTGAAVLHVDAVCRRGGVDLAMTFGGGRWNASLDTATLSGSCHTVSASIDGLAAGSFYARPAWQRRADGQGQEQGALTPVDLASGA